MKIKPFSNLQKITNYSQLWLVYKTIKFDKNDNINKADLTCVLNVGK